MLEYTRDNITSAVLDQMSGTADPRMKEIMEAACATSMPSRAT